MSFIKKTTTAEECTYILPDCEEVAGEQGSKEWLQARASVFTASHADDFNKRLKNGDLPKAVRDLCELMAYYRLFPESYNRDDTFNTSTTAEGLPLSSPYLLERGKISESYARDLYCKTLLEKDKKLKEHNLLIYKKLPFIAASPDGVIYKKITANTYKIDGLIEIKTPTPINFFKILVTRVVPTNYYNQMQHQMLVTGATWVDFIAYNPAYNSENMLICIRVKRDEAFLEEYVNKLKDLNELVSKNAEELKASLVIQDDEQETLLALAEKRRGLTASQVEEIARENKSNYIRYSGFGDVIIERDDLPEDVKSLPSFLTRLKEIEKAIELYLEDHPEYKTYPTRDLKKKAYFYAISQGYDLSKDNLDEENNYFTF